jgi:hypothetical protein
MTPFRDNDRTFHATQEECDEANLTAACELARHTSPSHFTLEQGAQRAESILREGCNAAAILRALRDVPEDFVADCFAPEGSLAEAQTIALYSLNGIWQGTNAVEGDLIALASLVLSLDR